MRLTRQLRRAFMEAAMRAVPSSGYDDQANALVVNWAVSVMPPKVRAVWDDPATRVYIAINPVASGGYRWEHAPCPHGTEVPAKIKEQADALYEKEHDERRAHRELRIKLGAVAESVTTTEKLALLLPDFAKYLPAAPEKAANLPAVAGVVEAFKAAGWPA